MQDARWLFFDLGNTLISEEAATEYRLKRLVSSLARYGRRCSIDEVRSAFQEASAEFAPRLLSKAIEKLIDDPASQRAVAHRRTFPLSTLKPHGRVAAHDAMVKPDALCSVSRFCITRL